MLCLGIMNTSSMRYCKHPIFMKIDYTEQEIQKMHRKTFILIEYISLQSNREEKVVYLQSGSNAANLVTKKVARNSD